MLLIKTIPTNDMLIYVSRTECTLIQVELFNIRCEFFVGFGCSQWSYTVTV